MLSWILSTILYLATIAFGFYLDFGLNPGKGKKSAARFMKWRRVYLVWLYIFLCFGYMTGADWRNYEEVYVTGEGLLRFLMEPASWFVFSFFPKIIPDFFVVLAAGKCLYLFSVYKLVSAITEKWASVLALMIPCQLGFMLIQNPFRFMLGVVFINFALYYLYFYITDPQKHKSKTVWCIAGLILVSVLFHTSCIIYFVLIPLSYLSPKLKRINPWFLFGVFLAFVLITSNLSFMNGLKRNSISFVQQFMEMSDYHNYEMEEGASRMAIANPIQILFFLFFVLSKDRICRGYKNGSVIYGFSIFYFFVNRLTVLIPTGFRLSLPFISFYAIFIVYMVRPLLKQLPRKVVVDQANLPDSFRVKTRRSSSRFPVKLCGQLMILYLLVSFGKKVWTSFDFIPYSNSIPYFVMGHKPFDERDRYNMDAYQARLGKPAETKRDEMQGH